MILTTLLPTLMMLSGLVSNDNAFQGAWQRSTGTVIQLLQVRDGYCSFVEYSVSGKKFHRTLGGPVVKQGDQIRLVVEYDTGKKENIGQQYSLPVVIKNGGLSLSFQEFGPEWKRVDDGEAPLAGNWRISGRLENGEINAIPKRDRKTLKLLTGTRFQWIAINPVTKEFFGTGGGSYRFENGKYIETIEFFSRDSTRVGASLEFDGRVEGDNWYHSGKSSKGEPLSEVWSREAAKP